MTAWKRDITNMRLLYAAAVTLLLAAGCSGSGNAKQEQQNASLQPGKAGTVSAASSASPLLLSEDLVERMIAVAQEGSAIKEASVSDDSDMPAPGSPDEIGDRLDANPAARALLARHGFTGRSYLAAMKTVASTGAAVRLAGTKWASRMRSREPVDPRNIAFYRQHAALFARLDQANDPGSSPDQREQITRELRQIDPDAFDDCVRITPATMAAGTISLRGTAAAPASSREQLAASLARFVPQFQAKQLKDDFTTMSKEIRRHAHEKEMHSPAYDAALADVTQWAKTHCKGAK